MTTMTEILGQAFAWTQTILGLDDAGDDPDDLVRNLELIDQRCRALQMRLSAHEAATPAAECANCGHRRAAHSTICKIYPCMCMAFIEPASAEAAPEAATPASAPPKTAMDDAAEMLWVVLANVSGGDWTQQTPEWREAAARWRDNYFAALKAEAAPVERPEQEK